MRYQHCHKGYLRYAQALLRRLGQQDMPSVEDIMPSAFMASIVLPPLLLFSYAGEQRTVEISDPYFVTRRSAQKYARPKRFMYGLFKCTGAYYMALQRLLIAYDSDAADT